MGAAQPIKGALEQGQQPVSHSLPSGGREQGQRPARLSRHPSYPPATRHTEPAFALEGVEC